MLLFCSDNAVSTAMELFAGAAVAGTDIPAVASPTANNTAAICLFFIKSFSLIKADILHIDKN